MLKRTYTPNAKVRKKRLRGKVAERSSLTPIDFNLLLVLHRMNAIYTWTTREHWLAKEQSLRATFQDNHRRCLEQDEGSGNNSPTESCHTWRYKSITYLRR